MTAQIDGFVNGTHTMRPEMAAESLYQVANSAPKETINEQFLPWGWDADHAFYALSTLDGYNGRAFYMSWPELLHALYGAQNDPNWQ